MTGVMMAKMGGTTNPVRITNRLLVQQGFSISPADATASATLELLNTGQAREANNPGGIVNIAGQWLLAGSASDFECRFTLQSGTINLGALGVWQALSATRNVGNLVTRAGNTPGSSNITGSVLVEIRRTGTSIILGSAVFDFDVTATVNI